MANNPNEMIIDLTGYKDRVGSRIIPGRYKMRVDDAEPDKTKGGDPMINVFLSVVGGEFEGATVVDRLLPANPKAQFRLVGFMQAIGLATPRKRIRINIAQWQGKFLEVDIEDGEPYNNRVKSEIRGYYRIAKGQGEADLPPVDGLEEFGASGTVANVATQEQAEAVSEAFGPAEMVPDDQLAAEREIAQAPEDDGDEFAPIDLDSIDLE